MNIDSGFITWLVLAALVLGTLAVLLDRVNFPQTPFQPKRIKIPPQGATRDRTGAHILDDENAENHEDDEDDENNGGTSPDSSPPAY